jgi:LmbE family N-acetylglucosaminyl deacetylase
VSAILDMAARSDLIVVAHGRLPGDLQRHASAMCEALRAAGHRLHVLRLTTGDGVPVHPLARGRGHIPENVVPQPWHRQ